MGCVEGEDGGETEGFCSSSDSLSCCPEQNRLLQAPRRRCPCGGWWPSSQTFLGSFVVSEQDSFLSVFCVFISQWKRVPFTMAMQRGEGWALGWQITDGRKMLALSGSSGAWTGGVVPGPGSCPAVPSASPTLAPLPTSASSCRGGSGEGCPHPAFPAPETSPSACLWLGFSLSPCKAMVLSEEINLSV